MYLLVVVCGVLHFNRTRRWTYFIPGSRLTWPWTDKLNKTPPVRHNAVKHTHSKNSARARVRWVWRSLDTSFPSDLWYLPWDRLWDVPLVVPWGCPSCGTARASTHRRYMGWLIKQIIPIGRSIDRPIRPMRRPMGRSITHGTPARTLIGGKYSIQHRFMYAVHQLG